MEESVLMGWMKTVGLFVMGLVGLELGTWVLFATLVLTILQIIKTWRELRGRRKRKRENQ